MIASCSENINIFIQNKTPELFLACRLASHTVTYSLNTTSNIYDSGCCKAMKQRTSYCIVRYNTDNFIDLIIYKYIFSLPVQLILSALVNLSVR